MGLGLGVGLGAAVAALTCWTAFETSSVQIESLSAWIEAIRSFERKNAFQYSIASVEVATARKFSCRERPRPLTTHESS